MSDTGIVMLTGAKHYKSRRHGKLVCATPGWNFLGRLNNTFHIPTSTASTWIYKKKLPISRDPNGLLIVPADRYMELAKTRKTRQIRSARKTTHGLVCATPGWDYVAKLSDDLSAGRLKAYSWIKAGILPSSRSPEGFLIVPEDRFRELAKTIGTVKAGRPAREAPNPVEPAKNEPSPYLITPDKANSVNTKPPAKLSPKQLEETYIKLESGFIEQTNKQLEALGAAYSQLEKRVSDFHSLLAKRLDVDASVMKAQLAQELTSNMRILQSNLDVRITKLESGQKRGWFR